MVSSHTRKKIYLIHLVIEELVCFVQGLDAIFWAWYLKGNWFFFVRHSQKLYFLKDIGLLLKLCLVMSDRPGQCPRGPCIPSGLFAPQVPWLRCLWEGELVEYETVSLSKPHQIQMTCPFSSSGTVCIPSFLKMWLVNYFPEQLRMNYECNECYDQEF